jgi:multidrug resistance efflux pump
LWIVLGWLALVGLATGSTERAVWLSGEVHSVESQVILVPPSNTSPVVLRTFVADGQRVRKGEVVLRIDAAQPAQRLAELVASRAQIAATLDRDIATLKVAELDAQLEDLRAQAALKKAQIDAGIPRMHVSALDFDRYAGELERANREALLRTATAQTAAAAVQRRREDGALELQKADTEIRYLELQVLSSEVLAERDGVVVHGFDARLGTRFDEGSSAFAGGRVGEIIDGGPLKVQAYALEMDRHVLSEGQTVYLSFDALQGLGAAAQIRRISGAPQAKSEWGDGRYYTIEIDLPADFAHALLPGASVRVGNRPASVLAPGPVSADADVERRPIELSGEIVALVSSGIAPPPVPNVWTLTLTQLAADGAAVKKGEPVAAFDGNEVTRQLSQKQGLLKEKQSEQERLLLELAERARNEGINTAQALAAADKSRRKASQPESLLPALQYRRLVVERTLAEAELKLLQQREIVAASQRKAEAQLVQSALQRLQQEVGELQAALAALQMLAPRDGVMMHQSNFRGEKFDVGSQVFRGQSVASIPDLQQLAIRAPAPEAIASRIQPGDRVRVDIEGVSVPALQGEVVALGRAVRSKSRVQPVPVVDVDIRIDPKAKLPSIKPGQAVRLKWLGAAARAAAGAP